MSRIFACAVLAAMAMVHSVFAGQPQPPTIPANDKGPSTGQTPYLVPLTPGAKAISIFSVGDTVGATTGQPAVPYRMAGIPDGLGAYDNGDGTFTLLMNHEIPGTGTVRAHLSKGAFVSKWKINKSTLTVVDVQDLIQTVATWNIGSQSYNTPGPKLFQRFCSADLPLPTGLFTSTNGNGTAERFFFNGEEIAGGPAYAHQVTGTNAGVSYELPLLGKCEHENVVVNPFEQNTTLVATLSDTSPTGPVYFYVGQKTSTGLEIDKAGLTNGILYGLAVNGVSIEDRSVGLGVSKNIALPFSLAAFSSSVVKADVDGSVLNQLGDQKGVTRFQRPEDGSWDSDNPNDFYFVTTDRLDTVKDAIGTQIGRSRLWKLHFTNLENPTAGGTITMLLDGTELGNMFDNITLDHTGHILIQEDVGAAAHNGKILSYDMKTGALEIVFQHDPARFGDIGKDATAPFTIDEESSGIIDASALFGNGWFLTSVQAHYISGQATGAVVPIDTTLVEGGQLLALYVPSSNPGNGAGAVTGVSSSQSPYVIPVAPGVKTISIFSVGDTANDKPGQPGVPYRMVGIPDGLGAFDNNDGTFTLTMNHELTSGAPGAVRQHGSNGAFVSKWTIEKKSLKVNNVQDLAQANGVFTTDPSGNYTAGGTTQWLRFCSADVPAVSALFNSKTGRGTPERIHMNGEESNDESRAFAHIITGPNAGKSYQLPVIGRFNHENSVACPVEQDKTIVIGMNDKSTTVGAPGVGQVYVYVGTKNSTGTLEVEKAGLTNGVTFGIVTSNGNPGRVAETQANGLGTTSASAVKGTTFPFSLAPIGSLSTLAALPGGTGTDNLITRANTANATTFLRPEDGTWDPRGNGDFYFVTTDALDTVKDGIGSGVGRSRLWRLRFNDILNPEFGGSITLMLDGTEIENMMDNVTMDKFGHILICEDIGGAKHNGKILLFDTTNSTLKVIAKHDPARFGDLVDGFETVASAPFTNDKETSGIIDASSILGPGWFLFDCQAHYTDQTILAPGAQVLLNNELVEGGQLLAMFVPEAAQTSVSFSQVSQVVNENVGTVTVTATLSSTSTEAVTVPFTVGGTATVGSDYTGLASTGTISIQSGSTSGSITFTIVNDTVREPSETITLTMGNPTNAIAGANTVHTVMILDDERGTGAVVNDSATTPKNTAVDIDVLANDIAVAGATAKAPVASFTSPTHGTVAKSASDVFTYTPATDYTGLDSFTYTVSDSQVKFKQTSPTLVSVANATSTKNVTVNLPNGGYGSAVAPVPGVANEFYLLTDRGPNADGVNGEKIFPAPDFNPHIGRFRIEGDGSMTRISTVSLKRADGITLLTGKPIPTGQTGATNEIGLDLSSRQLTDTDGIDSEGLVALADGTFWVSDEYGPFLAHFAADGTQLERINPLAVNGNGHKLPKVLATRVINKGMEGLTITPDGTTLVGMMQDSLNNGTGVTTPNSVLRLVTYKIADGTTKQYVYLLEKSSLGVSEITALSDHEFLALERDGNFPGDSATAVKSIFKFDITGATDVSDPNDGVNGKLFGGSTLEQVANTQITAAMAKTALAAVSVTPVTKSLFIDITKFKTIYNHDKMEGLCVINGGKTVVVTNDDDFVLATDTAGDSNPASRVKVKKSTGGVTDTSEMLLIDIATGTVSVKVPALPSITSTATATPNPAGPTQTITFSVGVDGAATVSWNFGDGSPATTGAMVTHAYATEGVFNVIVTATAADGTSTSNISVIIAKASNPMAAEGDLDGDGIANSLDPDDDNDGYSDKTEIAMGSNPLSAASTPNNKPAITSVNTVAPLKMKLAIKLAFKPLSDSLTLTATLPGSTGGTDAMVDVGGNVQSFSPLTKGKSAKDKTKSFTVSKDKVSIKLTKLTLAPDFADEGVTNAAADGKVVNINVAIITNGKLFSALLSKEYTNKNGKGSVK